MRILFLSNWFPYPPDNGAKIRIYNLIKQLSLQHQVHLISFAADEVDQRRLGEMHEYCQQVDTVPSNSFHSSRPKAVLGLFSQKPRSVVDTYSRDMQKLVEKAQVEHSFDLLIASELGTALYAIQPLSRTPKILEEIELTIPFENFSKQHQHLKKARNELTWRKLSHYVAYLLKIYDGCTVVSEQERERVRQILPNYDSIGVIPNGVDVNHHQGDFGQPEADTLVYAGALTYNANFDAIDFFLKDVFPLIQGVRPNIKLSVTGKLEGVPIHNLPHYDGVTFSGYVDDIRPVVARSWISIVPLRVGGGTRLKILESLALGTPVVTTSRGVEGLDLVPGRDLLVADTPSDFAAAVVKLLQDRSLRDELSFNGRQAVATTYDWSHIGRQFNDFVELVASKRASKHSTHAQSQIGT